MPRSDADLAKVCAGDAFADAPAFVRPTGPAAAVPIVVLGKYLDEQTPTYRRQTLYLKQAGITDPKKVSLVACLDIKRQEPPAPLECRGNFKIYDSQISLRVVEVKTGKASATDTVTLARSATGCSSTAERGGPKDYRVADLEGWVFTKLAPFLPENAEPPDNLDSDLACAGSPVPAAPPYTPGTKGKIVIDTVSESGHSTTGPVFGELELSGSPREKASKFELVACVVEKLGAKSRDCKFDGGKLLALHEGTYEVRIVEARTAKVVETRAFKTVAGNARASACPTIWDFSAGDRDLLAPDPALGKYLAGFGAVFH